MKKFRSIVFAVVLAAGLLPAMTAQADGVLRLDFEKELVADGVWSGSVETQGAIRTILTDVRETGNVWHLEFDWHVFEIPGSSFQAQVSGVLNLKTGKVSLNGDVIDGDLAGSRISVDADLDLADFSSTGTMTITP